MRNIVEEYECPNCGHTEERHQPNPESASFWDEFANLMAVGLSDGENLLCSVCGHLMNKKLTRPG